MRRAVLSGYVRDSTTLRNLHHAPHLCERLNEDAAPLRFDDSLKTVLAAETASGHGAQSAWRQLVDLIGRGRVVVDEPGIARLRMLRQAVPDAVRAASARAIAFASPPAALVGLFGEDTLAIAAPVLRTATLDREGWASVLPRLSPAGRSVLRHRRDLPKDVRRALDAFGATDFVLHHDAPPIIAVAESRPVTSAPLSETPFVALGEVARGLPVVAEALRRVETPTAIDTSFEISDLVARIDAYNRSREVPPPRGEARRMEAPAAGAAAPEQGFRFETDAAGTIRWVEGVARTPLVGLCLAHAAQQGEAQVDGAVAGAYRRRSPFRDGRLEVGGTSDAAGGWRLGGVPAFDTVSGRFLGYRGNARRPRPDESASPPSRSHAAADSLRQLVHELRTPTNAIAGFAELIEAELLGLVAEPYRDHAVHIREQATALIHAIDDLDTAARIEGGALDLRQTIVPLRPLVAQAVADLQPLAALRRATVTLDPAGPSPDVTADDRALERLIGRMLAALVAVAMPGETIGIRIKGTTGDVSVAIDRPSALCGTQDSALLSIDADRSAVDGAPLLGTGFALRLATNLAVELGGTLTIDARRLTLRLLAAVDCDMGQASTK